MLDIGRNALRDVDEEHASFHLEKEWKAAKIVQERKACLEIESIDEFDINHEVGCSMMMELDGRKPFSTSTCLECSSLGRSHET